MSLTATASIQEEIGYFRIFARPPGGRRREITLLRGAPVVVNSVSFADPFTDQTAAISLPQVTPWDTIGEGDLDWMVPDCDIDIVWHNTGEWNYDWRWEGFIVSFDFSADGASTGFNIAMKGAFFGLDDYLAKPEFPTNPLPYEHLIKRAFDQKVHPCRLGQLKITFPERWGIRVPENKSPDYLSFLKPWGVSTGEKWTGFTSRSTGTWEPVLTGHVQSLLTVMFANGGSQWTIRNNGKRQPELYLRQKPNPDDPGILEVTMGAPGVSVSGSKDYTQRANVLYGNGTDDAGIQFNGMEITPDGGRSYFKPYAFSPASYPRTNNPNYNQRVKPKETLIQFQTGVSEDAARKIAKAQLYRFSEPGITGTITLSSDLRTADGKPFPRMLIRAGQTMRIKWLFGVEEGILVHIVSADVDFNALTVSLSFDSKYRDELTVAEVRARTRDALTPLRSLQVGKYSNTVQDLIMPWSYRDGSGCIPEASKNFYNKLPSTATFPYEEFTRRYPPSNPSYAPWYIRLGPTDATKATNNWTKMNRNGGWLAVPVRMSQGGSIKLSQIAAYDKNGNVLPVKFHLSVYKGNGVAADAMPKFSRDPDVAPKIKYLKPGPSGVLDDDGPPGIEVNYGAADSHPFFEGAWEKIKPDGTAYENDSNLPANGADLIVGWGNYYEPAGYWPGRFSKGAKRTGMLRDSASWSWDLSDQFDPQNGRPDTEYAGYLYVQIYCDDQGPQPVYFLGKFSRQEPGS